MVEVEKKKFFWATMPGILTGIAAIITALTGLYIAINAQNNGLQTQSHTKPNDHKVSTITAKEWPLVKEETFTEISSGWPLGSTNDEKLSHFDRMLISGKYRWDIGFLGPWERYLPAPYGPATDFYLAVDIRFVSISSKSVAASLLFGRSKKTDYGFQIRSNGKFRLKRWDGKRDEDIINWTPISLNQDEPNRIAVSVENGHITLYVNSNIVGEYKDHRFSGGKVGISLQGWNDNVLAVVDFDNFEFRRK